MAQESRSSFLDWQLSFESELKAIDFIGYLLASKRQAVKEIKENTIIFSCSHYAAFDLGISYRDWLDSKNVSRETQGNIINSTTILDSSAYIPSSSGVSFTGEPKQVQHVELADYKLYEVAQFINAVFGLKIKNAILIIKTIIALLNKS